MGTDVLIVDDDALMRRSLAFTLEQAGYITRTANSAENAIKLIEHSLPDLILLDIGLPGMDGLQALQKIRQIDEVPVIFLTARRRELDEILGLELGAEDYVTKPFNEDVLLARIRSVLRRSTQTQSATNDRSAQPIVVGDIKIDPDGYTVHKGEIAVDLAPKAFELLMVFASNPGKVLSTEDLLLQVWGAEYMGEPQVVYVQIRWLREKLEEDPSNPKRIITVRGIGYKFIAEG